MQAAGYQVLGVALAGGAAEVLQAETGAPSWNIADFLVRCESGSLWAPDGRPLSLGPNTILLIDEGGTVDSRTFARLIDVAERSGVAALRTVGDPKQTQPVGAGGIFAHLARQLPTAVLSTNYRQGQHQGAAEASASALLRDGQAGKYLMVKDHAGLLQVDDSLDLSTARAVEDWPEPSVPAAHPGSTSSSATSTTSPTTSTRRRGPLWTRWGASAPPASSAASSSTPPATV